MDFLLTKTMICCSSIPKVSEQGSSQTEIIKEKPIFQKQNEWTDSSPIPALLRECFSLFQSGKVLTLQQK